MILHRPLDPATAAEATPGREPSPFSISWARAQELLQAEANHLGLTRSDRRHFDVDVHVEVDLPPSAIRLDGGIKANAPRERSDVVAVSIATRDRGELRMVSAHYTGSWSKYLPGWQANVYAIAKTLEALRAVDRWGAARGQQYRGFAAIGATSTGTALGTGLTRADATALLCDAIGITDHVDVMSAEAAAVAWRKAARRHHPDAGGDPAVFARLTEARDLLLGARDGR